MGKEMIKEKLFRKYADTDENEKFRLQRERLEQFYHDLHLKLKILLGEMEGDLRVLKEKDFDKGMWVIFMNLWKDMIDISKEITPDKPYQGTSKLVSYVKSRPHKSIIENLDYLVQDFLKKNEVDFRAGPRLQQVQIKSLKLLKSLADHVEAYMTANPLLPVPSGKPPAEEPDLAVKPEEFKPGPASEGESTYIPPARKNQ